MKDRIQKLCKRLKRFTLEEIALIAEMEESKAKNILQALIKENLLMVNDNYYIYNNIEIESKLKKRLPKMFEYHPQETIDMIINCFCAEIPSAKTGLILKPQENCICSFNLFFRQRLYEKQYEELLKYFSVKPQVPRNRMFFGKKMYFYTYNNNIYISEKLLLRDAIENFSPTEQRQFKILYSFLTRRLNHNNHKKYIHFNIAEQIWRYKKEYHFLKSSLMNILF